MVPNIGMIVLYKLSASDASSINQRRNDAKEKAPWYAAIRPGAQVHAGNEAKEGDEFPLIITRVWGTNDSAAFNGQVMLDGNDTLWATSTQFGNLPHQCRPMPAVG